MISKVKYVLFTLLIVFVLYFVGYIYSGSAHSEDSGFKFQVVFNDCCTYEKLGEDFVENSEHDIESELFDENSKYSEICIDGFSHVHYLLPKEKGGYYCAAIGNDGLKYILALDEKMVVDSFVKVRNLPAKLFEHKNTVVAYYICDGEASLYTVDIKNNKIDLLVDGISISDSTSMKIYDNNEQQYFDFYEYEYEEYLKSGNDLLFALFDVNCFESVYLNDNSIAYKIDENEKEQEWIVKQNEKNIRFSNDDRCFGFVGKSELLFYKCLHLGLYDIGIFYKYDYLKERNSNFNVILHRGITQGEVFDDKLYFSLSNMERVHYYCLDIETHEYYKFLKECPTVGYFSRPIPRH